METNYYVVPNRPMEETLRTVQIWLDDSFMEIELNQPRDWDEDKFYKAAVDYVLSNISIDVL